MDNLNSLDNMIQDAENRLKALKTLKKRRADEELRRYNPNLPKKIKANWEANPINGSQDKLIIEQEYPNGRKGKLTINMQMLGIAAAAAEDE